MLRVRCGPPRLDAGARDQRVRHGQADGSVRRRARAASAALAVWAGSMASAVADAARPSQARRRPRPPGPGSKSTARPGAPHVATAGNVGGSSSGWFGRCRQARIIDAGTMNSERHDLGDRQAIECPVRVPQRLEREPDDPVPDEEDQEQVAGSQALAQVVADPDQGQRPEHAGDRLVQEERMEARRLERVRRARQVGPTRYSHSIGMPHGRVVGGPYSSWLKKFPQRAIACIVNRPGATMSAQRRNGDVLVARVEERRDDPGRDPAVDAEARIRGQEDLDRVVLVQRPLIDDVIQPAADERGDRPR